MTKARQKDRHDFHINYYSEQDETRYKGDFTCKKLNIRGLSALGVRKAQLNGGMHYDPERPGHGVDVMTDEFNSILAHLDVSIIRAPKWWDLDSITDTELLSLVFEEVTKFENNFLNRGRNSENGSSESEESGEGSSSQDDEGADSAGIPRALVESEVPSALEP